MKQKINLFSLFTIIAFAMASCGSDSNSTNSEAASNNTPASTSNNCLEAYYGKPGELLTADLVGKAVDFGDAIPEVSTPKGIYDDDYATANCKWNVNRERRIVRLQGIKKVKAYQTTPLAAFTKKHQTKTEEDVARTKEALNKELGRSAEGDSVKGLLGAMDLKFEYENIDGVGDAAVWEHKVNNLIVLLGDYQFTVNVDLRQGNEKNLEVAKEVAKAIIEKACQ